MRILALFLLLGFACNQRLYAKELELTVITAWNRSVEFAQDFQNEFVKPFNDQASGQVNINYLGGPEVIPQRQMVYALRRGVVDMYFGAATYMLGLAPEADAFLASSITPQEARSNGAIKAISKVWTEKLNAKFLGWHQTGPMLHIFTKSPPQFTPYGLPDLTALRVRTTPTYKAFLDAIGTTPVDIPSSEVYTALERGVVDAVAWTSTSMSQLGFQKFVKYRLDPGVLGLVMTLQINNDTWVSMTEKHQRILQQASLEYEKSSRTRFLKIAAEEKKALLSDGMTFVSLPENVAIRYKEIASDAVWQRMARRDPSAAKQLQPLFNP
jgi:TRAP-type C4-dicarboxylate transport system substrate-binding protein